jgi:hypothetical protein
MKSTVLLTFLIFFIISGLSIQAQPHILLQEFTGYQKDEQLILHWTFPAGSLCEGTRIERSTDEIIYREIGQIPGFCGSPDSPVTYSFIDSFPRVNSINYYRLELGNYGYTSSIPVECLSIGEYGFVVLSTNTGQTEILFENNPGRTGTAIIYSGDGKRISEVGINGRRISLPPGRFTSGVYLLMLAFSDDTSVSGNFVVP